MSASVDFERATANKRGYDARLLDEAVRAITGSKRIVCMTGAGISTAAGIPDFRSKDGLYELAARGASTSGGAGLPSSQSSSSSSSYSPVKGSGSGADMFSASVFNSSATLARFYAFIASLHAVSTQAKPTKTHEFLNILKSKKRLLRVYTQNIDGLELRSGLEACRVDDAPCSTLNKKGKSKDKFVGDVVHLHGRAGSVRCTVCGYTGEWTAAVHNAFSTGRSVKCTTCEGRLSDRQRAGKRTCITVGSLRPDITLYGEQGREDAFITDISDKDILSGRPDCLIVMGTSLKVHGFKRLVKDFAAEVLEQDGKIIYVNLGAPSKDWERHIDYHIEATTDDFVAHVVKEWKRRQPGDWEKQTLLPVVVSKKMSSITEAGKPSQKPSAAASVKEARFTLPMKNLLGKKDVNALSTPSQKVSEESSITSKKGLSRVREMEFFDSSAGEETEDEVVQVFSSTCLAAKTDQKENTTVSTPVKTRKYESGSAIASRKRKRDADSESDATIRDDSSDDTSDEDVPVVVASLRPSRSSKPPATPKAKAPEPEVLSSLTTRSRQKQVNVRLATALFAEQEKKKKDKQKKGSELDCLFEEPRKRARMEIVSAKPATRITRTGKVGAQIAQICSMPTSLSDFAVGAASRRKNAGRGELDSSSEDDSDGPHEALTPPRSRAVARFGPRSVTEKDKNPIVDIINDYAVSHSITPLRRSSRVQ